MKLNQKGFAPVIILVGILILAGVSSGIYFVLKGNPFATPSQNSDYYEKLTQQCERFGFGAGGCCRDSADRMRDGNFLLEPKEGCLQGFKREMLKCIETYKWCEPEKPTPTSSVDEATNWKTYVSNTYQFSIKYKNDWTYIENSEDVTFYPPGVTKGTWEKFPEKIGTEPCITISIQDKPFSEPPKTFGYKDITQLKVNGQIGYYYIALGAPISPTLFDLPYQNGTNTLEMLLISAGSNIEIYNRVNHSNIQDADEEIFKAMISTFKFLDKEPPSQIYWEVPDGALPPATEKEVKSVFKSFDTSFLQPGQHLVVMGVRTSPKSGNFIFAGMAIKDKNDKFIPTDGFEYLLYKEQNIWKIITPGDDNFCQIFKKAPEDLTESMEDYYGCT